MAKLNLTAAHFELLKTVADRDDLDITDEEIRYGHHRIKGYAWLLRTAVAAERERIARAADHVQSRLADGCHPSFVEGAEWALRAMRAAIARTVHPVAASQDEEQQP